MRNQVSVIYRNVFLYRFAMNLLYTGGYKTRFYKVIKLIKEIKPADILELCFGDIIIAEFCNENNIKWTGFDLNEHFIFKAKSKKFNVKMVDLSAVSSFQKSEICLMIGSLYHFHDEINSLLSKMLSSSKTIIISEPIKNLSDRKNIIGWIARKSANAGKGEVPFRYNEVTFLKMLNEESRKLSFQYTIIDYYKKDIIIAIEKNGKN